MPAHGHQIPEPPFPGSKSERLRWQHTRDRRRLLDGTYFELLTERVQKHIGSVRRQMMGPIDMSGNIFATLARELATLYLRPWHLWHPEVEADPEMMASLLGPRGAIDRSGLVSIMLRYQAWVIGCREYSLRVDVTSDGELSYRTVPPDHVLASAPIDAPGQPDRLAELRLRQTSKGAPVWTWDAFDVSDPAVPTYRIVEAESGRDPSKSKLWGDQPPADWFDQRCSTSEGIPVLPFVMHHAEVSDKLWDPYEGINTYEGSLNHGVLLSHWMHLMRDASWIQRVAMNVQPRGMATVDGDEKSVQQEVVTDLGSLLVLEVIDRDEAQNSSFGTFPAAGDPEVNLAATGAYAARLAVDAGVSPSDLQKNTADQRSGLAISLTNEGKRASQRRFMAPFREADQRTIALSALMLNRATGTSYPESGYEVGYASIPLSPEERQSRREHWIELMEKGLASRVQAYMGVHDVSKAQAKAALHHIDEEDDTDGGRRGTSGEGGDGTEGAASESGGAQSDADS